MACRGWRPTAHNFNLDPTSYADSCSRGKRIDFIQPGQPQQNAYADRYNKTVRYDWLAHHLFETLQEIQDFATNWLWAYIHERPNMALGDITPKQKLTLAA
jgi:putative transposase